MLCLRQMVPQRVHLGCRKSKLRCREINTWEQQSLSDRSPAEGHPCLRARVQPKAPASAGMQRSGRDLKYLEQVSEKRGEAEKAQKPRHVGDRRQDNR